MGTVRMSEKEAIARGIIPDPRLVPISPPEKYRVPNDHDWSTGPDVDSDGRFTDDRPAGEDRHDEQVAASDFLTAIFIMIGWVVGFVMGVMWSAPK